LVIVYLVIINAPESSLVGIFNWLKIKLTQILIPTNWFGCHPLLSHITVKKKYITLYKLKVLFSNQSDIAFEFFI